MRHVLRAVTFALMAGVSLAPAQAADILYPARHPYPVRHAYPIRHYPGWPWVVYPPVVYAPISPEDYSLPNAEIWARSWEPYPYCCPYPTYSPLYP
jgi:hypothetical protein